MAATVQLLWSPLQLAQYPDEEDTSLYQQKDVIYFKEGLDDRNTTVSPSDRDLKQNFAKQSPTSWISEQHTSGGMEGAQDGEFDRQVDFADRSEHFGYGEAAAFVAVLRACATRKDLHKGTRVHEDIVKRGLLDNCLHHLVIMYASCGALTKAQELLEMRRSRNVFSWTTVIAGHVRQGQAHSALTCFDKMMQEGLSPDAITFSFILKACGVTKAVGKGRQLHDELVKRGLLLSDIVLGNALVDMYVKCDALAKAQQVLEELPSRDVISWNTLITGYAQQDQAKCALDSFERMKQEGIAPDRVTFSCILKACASIRAVDKGEKIHEEIAMQGLLANDVVLGNALVDMYAKCGALVKAQKVLDELPCCDVVSWNALISGYAQHDESEQALNCFEHMQCAGFSPNSVTFSTILKACGSIGALDKGEEIHDEIARQGLLNNDVVLGTALIDMYAKCGVLAKAQHMLDELTSRNVVSWNALITGYAQAGEGEQALTCFQQMQHEGHSPDVVTFTSILKACGNIRASERGQQIHADMVTQGLAENDLVLGNALVDMYAKCGALERASRVLEDIPFRDAISWNAFIAGCAEQKQGERALQSLEYMCCEGLSPDATTFACILKACGSMRAFDKGEQIHKDIVRQGLLENDVLMGTALVDMYAKCGALPKARQLFEELHSCDAVAWNALITGYAEESLGEQALECFHQMKHEGFFPDVVTFASILKACGCIGAVDKGEQIYNEAVTQGMVGGNDLLVGTAMVDMYAKCGALTKAQRVLDELPSRNAICWNALITGYAKQGQHEQTLQCFEQMRRDSISPNAGTFSCVLNACNHFGLVEDGYKHFMDMSIKYGIKPDLEHYTCMIDLFGRAGHLNKAIRIVHEMPASENSAVWSAVLGACRKWGHVNTGRWAFDLADKRDEAAYVLIADIYAAAGLPEDAM